MIGIIGHGKNDEKPWPSPNLQFKFRNSSQGFYRKTFAVQLARGQYQCPAESQLVPLIVLSPAEVANDHEAFWKNVHVI